LLNEIFKYRYIFAVVVIVVVVVVVVHYGGQCLTHKHGLALICNDHKNPTQSDYTSPRMARVVEQNYFREKLCNCFIKP
jgi:hypothetical protein